MSDRLDTAIPPPGSTGTAPSANPFTRGGPRRTALLIGVFLALAALLGGILYAVNRDVPPPPVLDRPAGPVNAWMSGASGDGVVDGEFGDWRGAPLQIAGTWADVDPDLQVSLPQLQPGGEFADWEGSLDLAIGAIGEDESWAEAADGEYDRRWRRSLSAMERLWGDRAGTLYIRFAHEMNGDWYPWSVTDENDEDFVTAWRRFRELQQEIFPESQLVFCVNRESVGADMDWREMFPGPEYVDVLAVDYYNDYPYVDTVEEFEEAALETDDHGAPKGIVTHLDFAREQGLPLAVPEWSGKATVGDSPAFVYGMYDLFAREGGTGPGEILYDILFNVSGYDEAYQMWPDTAMPSSAQQYRDLW